MDRWVVASPPGTLPPPVDRISLTYPVLNAARQVLFIVTGASKADAVKDVLEGGAPRERRPAAGIQPTSGGLIWYLDRPAAHLLSKSS
jgi:6-phosphogluconolactonase